MKSVVISIIQSVHKTNSSDGNWAVTALVKFPWVTTEYTFFFFNKNDAKKVIVGYTFNM